MYPFMTIVSAEAGWRWAYAQIDTVAYWPVACFALFYTQTGPVVEAMVADVVSEPAPLGLVPASSIGTNGARGRLCPPGFVGVMGENRRFEIVRAET